MGELSIWTLLLVAGVLFLLTRIGERLATGRQTTHVRSEPAAASACPICPSCCRPIAAQANFCPHCRTPLSGYAATGPIESIAAEGELFRRSSASPSAFIVICPWLIVLPCLVIVLLAAWDRNLGFDLPSIAEVIVSALLVLIAVRATMRHRSGRQQHRGSGAKPPV